MIVLQPQGTNDAKMKPAFSELDEALKADRPTLAAFFYRIVAGISSRESFDEIEELCQRATEYYPANTIIPKAVCSRLAKDIYGSFRGEPGDPLSLARSASTIIQRPEADLNYTRIVGSLSNHVSLSNSSGKKSVDMARIKRGIREWERKSVPADGELIAVFHLLQQRSKGSDDSKRLLAYLMGVQAGFPRVMRLDSRMPGSQMIKSYFRERFEKYVRD